MPITVSHQLSMTTPDNPAEAARLLQNARSRKSYEKHKLARQEKNREYQRKRHAENKDHVRALAKAWNEANKDQIAEWRKTHRPAYKQKEREYSKKWHSLNPEKHKAYYQANKELWRERYRIWSKNNPDKEAARAARRRAGIFTATPKWADLKKIESIYVEAKQKSISTGITYHVDHIIPLKGKNVCGLHCECNLQIIPAVDNMRKANKCL